ncbi:MAG: hypothetical protein JSR73_03905 [Proteobacteria bacterium]|nr:hypothetical protein [Pseudomonadota bacterium]
MTNPQLPRPRWTAATERAASLVTYAAFAIGTAAPLLLHPSPAAAKFFVALRATGVLGCIALFLVSRYSRQVHASDLDIDERERAQRAQSYMRAFQILIGAVFVLFLLVLALDVIQPVDRRDSILADVLVFLGVGGFALPAAVLAWQDRVNSEILES